MANFTQSLRRNWRSIFILITVVIDTGAIISSALVIAFLLDAVSAIYPVSPQFFVFFVGFSTPVLLIVGTIMGLYRSAFHSNVEYQNRVAGKTYFYSFLIVLASFSAFGVTDYQRAFVFPVFIMMPALWLLGRAFMGWFNLFMQERGYGIHKALIVGYENGGRKVFERFTGFPELGYDIRGFVSKTAKRRNDGENNDRLYVPHYSMKEVETVVKTQNIDRILIPSPKFITNGYSDLIRICKKKRIELKVLSPEAEQLLRLARIHDIAGITLYAPRRIKFDTIRNMWKRLFDIVIASIAVLFLSPIFLLTALAIHWESGSPVLFRQKRASIKGGRTFYFYKFRSMVKNADEMKQSLFDLNESDGALFKLKNDPRLTKVGRFIRKYSIDELPQLFNVLKGDMSLVGPRPLPISDFEKVNEGADFWEAIRDREKVKPGITGLWQISGRSEIGFKEMVLLDLYYVENQSLLFDLEILAGTIPVVVFGKGAY